MALAQLLGQRALLAGRGAGMIAGQEYDQNVRQQNFTNMFRVAGAQQNQANFVSNQNTQNYWKGVQDNFNRHSLEEKLRRDDRFFDYKQGESEKAWEYKKQLFERQNNQFERTMELNERQADDLKDYREGVNREKEKHRRQKAMAGQVKKRTEALDILTTPKVDDLGNQSKSAAANYFVAELGGDRRNPGEASLSAGDSIGMVSRQGGIQDFGKAMMTDLRDVAHYVKKATEMNGEWWTSQWDLMRYRENREKFVAAYHRLDKWYQMTNEPIFRQKKEEMRSFVKHFDESYNYAGVEADLEEKRKREQSIDIDEKAEAIMSGDK